ncbi:hypothetical protein [Pelomicrobium methylotrophicum]|uniref:Uncharacterized protein n=1 Tax=Pelomicrobium methylotrophicum TaxID=2602750 RepID=A0A5C7F2J0_9PROT|nr:hypothetical protein [Pelomicrobium methylotrophicum]TXF13717.1 hypothetical protein FR698_01010 [Pelomicrobium methylotrophicum]
MENSKTQIEAGEELLKIAEANKDKMNLHPDSELARKIRAMRAQGNVAEAGRAAEVKENEDVSALRSDRGQPGQERGAREGG